MVTGLPFCKVCGATIHVKRGQAEVVCPACGSTYEVVRGGSPPPQMVCYPMWMLEGARKRLGSMLGTRDFDPQYDVNRDNVIDQKDLDLIRKGLCALIVRVHDLLGRPVEDATVEIDGGLVASARTDETGMAGFPKMGKWSEATPFPVTPLVVGETYNVKVTKDGYKQWSRRWTFRREGQQLRVGLLRART